MGLTNRFRVEPSWEGREGAQASSLLSSKTCTRCRATFAATEEFFSSQYLPAYPNRLSSRCKQCMSAMKKAKVDARRRAAGLPILRQAKSRDPARERRVQKAWRDANPDKVRQAQRRYRERNPEKLRQRDRLRAERRKTDPTLKFHAKISRAVRKSLRGGNKAGRSWAALVGYSRDQLMEHIERQFEVGMSWAGYYAGEIHIDHIRPVSQFLFACADDQGFRDCWALTNLRPMWAPDNLKKNAKRVYLI